jgi:hypothetical protein
VRGKYEGTSELFFQKIRTLVYQNISSVRNGLLSCSYLLLLTDQKFLLFFQEEESSASGVSALNLINVGGIFLVLLIGLVLGIFMAAIEKFWNAWKKKKLFN